MDLLYVSKVVTVNNEITLTAYCISPNKTAVMPTVLKLL